MPVLTPRTLRYAWGALLTIGAALEAYTALNADKNETLSEVMEDADRDLPILPLAVGVVAGHWFPSIRGVSLLALGIAVGAAFWPIGGRWKK